MLWLGVAIGFVLGWLGKKLYTRRRWQPSLRAVIETSERLARGDHDARAQVADDAPLSGLAKTVNLLAERFQHDIAELRRLEEVRREFVANVSHELRTPLASIKAFAETLRAGGVDKTQTEEFLGEIEGSADRMTRLVDDLLALSALESGKMPPRFEPLELYRVAAEAAASLKPLAQKKNIVLRVEAFGDVPRVRADRGQLKQVFTNLLDNAIKFTPDGGTVRVSAAAAAGTVSVTVDDNGPGIPPEHLPRLFERFYRVDKARSREEGGTGLGLSIVKHIVELHGGKVQAQGAPGAGAAFTVTLPAIP